MFTKTIVILLGFILLCVIVTFNNFAFAASDSTVLYHAKSQKGTQEVFTTNADGSSTTQITKNGGEYPSWSPDGKKIVFHNFKRGNTNSIDIFVINADGSGEKKITNFDGNERFPNWSPDGKKIVFQSDNPPIRKLIDIYVMNSDGSGLKKLTDNKGHNTFPKWSPDGKTILFVKSIGTKKSITVMNVDGKEQRDIISLTEMLFGGASWSPDGKKIAYTQFNKLFTINADGSGEAKSPSISTSNVQCPSWSPNNSGFLYYGIHYIPGFGIYAMTTDGDTNFLTWTSSNACPTWKPSNVSIKDVGKTKTDVNKVEKPKDVKPKVDEKKIPAAKSAIPQTTNPPSSGPFIIKLTAQGFSPNSITLKHDTWFVYTSEVGDTSVFFFNDNDNSNPISGILSDGLFVQGHPMMSGDRSKVSLSSGSDHYLCTMNDPNQCNGKFSVKITVVPP